MSYIFLRERPISECKKKENAVGGNTKEKARDDFALFEKCNLS